MRHSNSLSKFRDLKKENMKLVETLLLVKPSIRNSELKRSFDKHR